MWYTLIWVLIIICYLSGYRSVKNSELISVDLPRPLSPEKKIFFYEKVLYTVFAEFFGALQFLRRYGTYRYQEVCQKKLFFHVKNIFWNLDVRKLF